MLNRLITGKNPMLDIVVRKNGNGSRFRTMRRGSPPVKNRSCTMQPLHWNERLPLSRTLNRRRFYKFPSFGIPSGIVKRIKPHVCGTYGPLPHPKEQPSDQVFNFGKILPPSGEHGLPGMVTQILGLQGCSYGPMTPYWKILRKRLQ
jgi:hypothetical protein